MALFTDEDKARIAAAIAAAEARTAGEIVCVVARSASDYRYAPIGWAAVLALAAPWPLLRFTPWSAQAIHLIQLATFILASLFLWSLPRRIALVPGFIRRQRARAAAQLQFSAQDMLRTAGRTGCLIYVAEAERVAIVLADAAIAAKVDDSVWRETIEALTDALKDDRAADGFVRAIEICGAVLATHAPPGARNEDELPNHLILL